MLNSAVLFCKLFAQPMGSFEMVYTVFLYQSILEMSGIRGISIQIRIGKR